MKLKREILEEGIIIRPDGTMRRGVVVKEGEIFLKFSKGGVRSELKNKIVITKTLEQAGMESILTIFYFLCAQRNPGTDDNLWQG